jgi:hypothetical protein
MNKNKKETIEFIGLWEQFNNPVFNSIEFDGIKIVTEQSKSEQTAEMSTAIC